MAIASEESSPSAPNQDPASGGERLVMDGLGHLRLNINCEKRQIDINKLSTFIQSISSKHIPMLSVYLVNICETQRIELGRLSEEVSITPDTQTENSRKISVNVALEPSEAEGILTHLAALAAHEGAQGSAEVTAASLTAALQGSQETPPDLIFYIGKRRSLGAANLWSGAYAEFAFFEGDFAEATDNDLAAALAGFGKRERRFGGVS